ncbi:hypothetical protein N7468_007097 [Penicillium chermesinum]|uniref:Yeast cell wall synthesis Kre9/Knh1-like N-terminal domain-containing protein n=1 Tax=Penicillium chermesinum TaxID=63820 RepID=A0A9W9TK76_9EURO|nr:uncharacterized protein N7468_007097 [Penicillium chermesinum]KAJ5225872.1 hypothetical protein N7468_007097 [Penicillium chermesinum]
MRMIFVSTILAFAATVAGIEILTPTIGQKESQDDSITVKWKYVSTDPPKMDIYLVNQNSYPNTKVLVASGVDSSSGQYKIKASDVKDIDTGSGYQVNFVDTNNGGILAQSQQFRFSVFRCHFKFDFCFLYFFSDSFLHFCDCYSLLHQLVNSFLLLAYFFTYFYCLIYYDQFFNECVLLY